jgi:DNA-binding CsgD family transcriptional regulator
MDVTSIIRYTPSQDNRLPTPPGSIASSSDIPAGRRPLHTVDQPSFVRAESTACQCYTSQVLSDADWRLVQRLGFELLEVTDPENHTLAALETLLRLVPADVAGELEIHVESQSTRVTEVPDLLLPQHKDAELEAVLAANPAVPYVVANRSLPASRIEELCGPDAWARNPMRRHLLEPKGVPHALITARISRDGLVHGWGLNRGRAFTDSERDALSAFQPFLWRAAAERQRRALISQLDHAVSAGAGLLIFRQGDPTYMNGQASALLERHELRLGAVLRLCRSTLSAEGQSGSLRTPHGVLRLQHRPSIPGSLAVVISEVALMQRPETKELITARQHMVLCYLAEGLTAAAIAHRLGLSARTVEKHLENLYRTLGARDRLEAVLKARDHGLLPVLQGCDRLMG